MRVRLKDGREVEIGEGRREFATGTVCTEEEGKTRQSELESTDVNKIIERMLAGQLPRPVVDPATLDALYIDVSDIPDYRTAFEQVDRARETFDKLSAEQRLVFENSPIKLLDAIDRQDRVLLEKANLVEKAPVVPPVTPPA